MAGKHDWSLPHNIRGDGKVTKCPPECPAYPWCQTCHRLKGVGCGCGMSIKDKHIGVDAEALRRFHGR